jgi:hypothetical protein
MGGAPGLGGSHSKMIHNNQPNNGFGGGGALERRCDRAKQVGEGVYPFFREVEYSDKKMKIERVMEP